MKILIVYTNYGTGHKRAAEALEDELKNIDESIIVKNIDIVTYSRPLLNKFNSILGEIIATKFRKFRFKLYEKHMYSKMDKSSLFVDCCALVCWTNKLKKLLQDFNADLIISTQAAPTELVTRHKMEIGNPKIANIFTDYGLHRYHLLSKKNIDFYFPPTEEIKQQLINYGIDKDKVFVTGIPVLTVFDCNLYNKKNLIKKYKFNESNPIFIFVAGGGLGFENTLSYFEELLKINLPFSYIFVSGKNNKLRKKAESIAKNKNKEGKILGYTNDIPELLNASDLMIGKPGGLITTECIEMNTPVYAIEPIPGQELKNIEFLTSNKFGMYSKTKEEFRFKIEEILKNNKILEEMKSNIEEYNTKRGAKSIVDILLKSFNNKNV